MLKNLTKRINQDENALHEREIFVECSHGATLHSAIEKFSFITDDNVNTDDLKAKLASVKLSDEITVEENIENILTAARSEGIITESVVSTSKSISMTKDDYNDLTEAIAIVKKSTSSDEEKKEAKKKIKSFLLTCARELRKCNDDRPADALVTAAINRLCSAYDCKKDYDVDKLSKKEILILKLNALAKVIK